VEWREQTDYRRIENSKEESSIGEHGVKCLYTKAGSVIAKMDELRNRGVGYDIIGVTESWENSEIYDAELQIPGYHMFRVDRRTTTRGGRVILYVYKSIDVVQLDLFDTIEFSDCVFCMLSLSGSKLIVGVCYRSLTSTTENEEALITLFNTVTKYVEKQDCVIMGDFNLPNVDFESFTVQGNQISTDTTFNK